jgi:hypothetical protein
LQYCRKRFWRLVAPQIKNRAVEESDFHDAEEFAVRDSPPK